MHDQAQTLADARRALQKFQLENEVSDLNREILAYQDLRRSLRSDRANAAVEARAQRPPGRRIQRPLPPPTSPRPRPWRLNSPRPRQRVEPETEAAVADPALLPRSLSELRSLARSSATRAPRSNAPSPPATPPPSATTTACSRNASRSWSICWACKSATTPCRSR